MRSTLLLVLYASAVVCLPHAVASIDDAVQSNTTHMVLLRSPTDPVGGSGSGSGSGSGQGTGPGKRPASPGECQGSPKRVKPDVDTHDETCFRAAVVENLLWFTTEEAMRTYNHDYSRVWNFWKLRSAGRQPTNTAQDMNDLCPELEGLKPDPATLGGGYGSLNYKQQSIPVTSMHTPGQSDWETHSSQVQSHGSYVNSYSRFSKTFVISSAEGQLWNNGIPSCQIPAQHEDRVRWADIAYYEWAVDSMYYKGAKYALQPNSQNNQQKAPTPTWFLIQAAATSADTKTITDYCLGLFGINELPVWPNIITFPTGTYCHKMLLGTASSAEVAQFLISRRGVLGHQVLLSVTVYATSDDKKQDAPNLLWQTANFEIQFDRIRQANGVVDFPETPDGFPYMLKPLPGGQGA